MSDEIIVSTGNRMHCPVCRELGRFAVQVEEDHLPVELACSGCGGKLSINDQSKALYRRMPKIDGSKSASVSFELLAPAPETPAKDTPVEPAGNPNSYREKMRECQKSFLLAMHQAADIRMDLAILSEKISEEFDRMIGETDAILSWNPRLMYHFLMNPVAAIPGGCLDPTIDARTKFLLCPKFYPRIHGFPIALHGGFYVQAVTPYSQIAFPLEIHLSDELDIPLGTQLRIAGDKIIGDGLHRQWVHVEGAVPDEDHTLNNPSLVVKDRIKVRQWIAKNGGKPWDNLQVQDQFFPYHGEMIESDCNLEAVRNFVKSFPVQGRTIVCWEDAAFARMVASIAGHGMRATKLVISDGPRRDWHAGFKMQYADNRLFVYANSQTYIDRLKLDVGAGSVGLIIVDATDMMPPLDFWLSLYSYNGPLIILLREPFMDTFDENVMAAAIYGLCNSLSVIPDREAWRKAWHAYERSPPEAIQRAFESIRMRFGNR